MKAIPKFHKNTLKASIVLVTILVLFTFTDALANAGSLDPTFGTNGIINTDLGIGSVAAGEITLTSNGKFYVDASGGVILRYNSDGGIDNTYGINGMVTLSAVENFSGGKSITLSDGTSVRCGTIDGEFAAVRYNADGTLDNTFGTNGIGTIPLSDHQFLFHTRDCAIQPDNKIVVFGFETGNANYDLLEVGRFNSNGAPDTTFGYGGYELVNRFAGNDRYNYASTVVVQPDGRILLSGNETNDGIDTYGTHIALARLNNDGSYDTSFGANSTDYTYGGEGTVLTVYTDLQVSDMSLQADGKIVVGGFKSKYPINDGDASDFAILRFNTDGTLDTSFGDIGLTLTDFGYADGSKNIVIQRDGRIIVVGGRYYGGDYSIIMARYNTDGSLDTSFGTNGKVIGNFGSNYEYANYAILQSDDKLLVTGSANHAMLIARYDIGPFGFSKQSPINGETGITSGSVTLSWNAVAPEPHGYGQSYKYCYHTASEICDFSSNLFATHITISGLKIRKIYYWQVQVITCLDASCANKNIVTANNGQEWTFTTSFYIFLPFIQR